MSRTVYAVLAVVILWAAPYFTIVARAQTASTTAIASSTQLIATTTHAAFDPYNPDDVEARVRTYFADIPVMIAIAKCESGFRQYNSSGDPLYGGTGGMVGVFQEAAAIHISAAASMGLNINTLDGNLAYARYLYDESGVAPWFASSNCWSPLKTTLQLGSVGAQVTALQQMLNASGYLVADAGPGSPGQESTTFGPATRDAVRRFQCSVGLVCSGSAKSTGYGMVGTKTRLALLRDNSQFAQATSSLSRR